MSPEEAKKQITRIYDIFNSRDLDKLDEIFDPEYEDYSVGTPFPTPFNLQTLKGLISMYFSAFPDAQWSVSDIMIEGDMAAWRDRFTGTNQGELMGMPPTGRKVDVMGLSMGELRNDKPYRHWGSFDNLGLMQQLGVVPMPGQAGGGK